MVKEKSHEQRVEEALNEFEIDSKELQTAIIYGKIQPEALAEILTAHNKMIVGILRLMLTVGEGKFVEQSIFKPIVPLLYLAAGSIISLGVASIWGNLT